MSLRVALRSQKDEGGTEMAEGIVDRSNAPERCCAVAGCTTILSVYNSDFLCWTHADTTTRARFERQGTRPFERDLEPAVAPIRT